MGNSGLVLLLLLGLLVWFWQNTLRARERALHAARELCQHQQLQLLDATVTLQSLRLRRGEDGRLELRRTFQFNYSDTGENRRIGFILMTGNRIDQVGL
jgi:Protein of unknown function (DUF3301)